MNISTLAKIIAVVAVLGATLFYFFGTRAPAVSVSPGPGLVGAAREITVKLDARGAGLKKLTVTAVQGEKKAALLTKEYPAGSRPAAESFTLAKSGLQDGPFTLEVVAKGASPRFGASRSTSVQQSYTLDTKPLDVAVVTIAHNINQGGAGLVVYTVSKDVEKSGVTFADRFFPGFRQGGNQYACLFPFPYDLDPARFVPRVTATDKAGNERTAGINYHLTATARTTDRINLTDAFLGKIAAEFKGKFPQAGTPLEIFLKANRDQRATDRKAIDTYGRETSPVPLWQGAFLRMPKTAPLGGFAQERTYLHQGKEVDRQTHLGFDLASLAHADVPAANRGKVIFAGDMGIYGQCIVIDHGLGLQSIYGHLSRIGVKQGDMVNKGQTIANTGATGMAGGDHLHFEIAVSGQSVSPIEWWDAHWIKNNIAGKLPDGAR